MGWTDHALEAAQRAYFRIPEDRLRASVVRQKLRQ